ncbi:hypothetical protein LPJ61_000943 [Coemansia biformis]|uniref:Molybdopterin synthase sulfur carrier subunit n=1 Tax=Coemansia biformis TaxID=1286918 RepID=A0A9W7YAW3_9FUNG|nr:hypothetical protein LPJ61_000943 [Coemansia biformis]
MVKVLYFAAARDYAGKEFDEVKLDKAAVGDKEPVLSSLLSHVEKLHAGVARILPTSLIAVNGEYCLDEHSAVVLRDSDEVAIIPPVSGG